MDEQLDNDLRNRIREVFENYEDPPADEGWQLLREKFPEKERNRRAIVWFWYGAAAVLFLFFGVGFLIYNEKIKPEVYAHKQSGINAHKNLANNNRNKVGFETKNGTRAENKENSTKDENHGLTVKVAIVKAKVKPDKISNSITGPIPASQIAERNTLVAANTTDTTFNNHTAPLNNNTISQTPVGTTNLVGPPIAENQQKKPKSINSMLAEETPKDQKTTDHTKNISFGVYAGTFFNYAKGSGNTINLGAGVTADIKITGHLKLVTGLAIAQNSLNYNSNIPAASQNSFEAASAKLLLPQVNTAYSFQPETMVTNYNASLVGLDIPLNLKYDFSNQKNGPYVAAGLSSGTFINEAYTYQYNYPASSAPFMQQTQGVTTNKSFSSFYLAKTLNLAFGAGLPFRKNIIFIEPFFKYPIGGLGSQELRFGSGGVNLKFYFQRTKK
jgi:hypothetical protein